jgi:ATP-binding cassette subfamily B protein
MRLNAAVAGVVLEGIVSGCNFLVLFKVLEMIFGNTINYKDIVQATIFLGIIFVIRLVLYAVSYTESQIGGAIVSKKLRIALGDKLRRIPLGAFTGQRLGYYINAATSEVADYEQILTHKLADITKYWILLVMLSVYAGYLNIFAGLIMFFTLLLLFPAMKFSIRQVNKYGKSKNLAREENVSAIAEYLTGSQTLRSYGLAGEKNETLKSSMKYFSNVSYSYERAMLPIGFAFMFLAYTGAAASIYISVNAYSQGKLTVPALIILAMLVLFSCKVEATLYMSMVAYRNLMISKGKISGIMEEKEEEKTAENYSPERFDITFKNVGFSYEPRETVLQNMSFTIPENKITAIVGESGSGKSTIFNLLSKYYEPDEGEIFVGGSKLSEASTEEALSYISLVDQDVFLFNDTIKNNLLFAAPNSTDEEVSQALKQANCNFVDELENGADTLVGENGNRLSGGEKQRLSIARAILRKSRIVLLDEATSSLDIENELLVKQAILNLLKARKTVVMIAHTLPIIQSADQILVVDGGQIAEQGTHEELIARNGKYCAMWKASMEVY